MSDDFEIGRVIAVDTAQVTIELNKDLKALTRRDGKEEQFLMGYLTVQRFKRGWMRQPDYALVCGEPDAERKMHVRFGEGLRETEGHEA